MPNVRALVSLLALGVVLSAPAVRAADGPDKAAAAAAARSAAAETARTAGTPEAGARAYYARMLSKSPQGLPTAAEFKTLGQLLTPALIKRLQAASKKQAQCEREAGKDEEGDIIEGNLFVGNYEGAQEVALDEPKVDGAHASVEARLFYVDARFPKAHKFRVVSWSDRLDLVQADGRWQVDDVHARDQPSLADFLDHYAAPARRCGAD